MVRSVLIGKGRRVTLDELQAIAYSDAVAELFGASDHETAAPSLEGRLSLLQQQDDNGDVLLSSEETRAVLTLLALNLSQGRLMHKPEATVSALLSLVNNNNKNAAHLPKNPGALANKLNSLLPEQPLSLIAESTIARNMSLAIAALSTSRATCLAQAATPIAALSAETSGVAQLSNYSEHRLDVARPHRGVVTSGAALRAILNESKRVNLKTTDANNVWIDDIPQYQGPALDALLAASKTLELEINCFETSPNDVLDDTVSQLAIQQAQKAVQTLLAGSQGRMMIMEEESSNEEQQPLGEAVTALEASLVKEAKMAADAIEAETRRAVQEAAEREAAKAARAKDAAPSKGGNNDNDEFANMTEAQKAKILKKRAEKEAKAAKKRAQKEKRGVSLFGSGTQPIVNILKEHDFELTEMCIAEMTQVIDKLLGGGVQRKPKIPKGTRDYLPEQMMIRQQAFNIIRRVFESHGAVEIDTPVFELKDTLTGKYGEDSKLIYDLADQGGELLALRYDLTVPFARFLALNSVGNIKRFHIGKVYRRDQPALSKGRYREFYQCDFDIAGNYGRMVPDAECVAVACDILDALPIGDFGIKLNHRRLLDAILELSGVPADKFRTICSAVDKLDKEPWSEVKREMCEDKGLDPAVADKIGTFVLQKGDPRDLYRKLMESNQFGKHEGALAAMEDLRILFDYLEAMDKLKFVSFDLSLARGLDYYTGVIYEAVCMSGNAQVGSIGGGGRYDNLVSMFQEAGKVTPCVGVSVGIERVFTLMEARLREEQGGSIKRPNVNVLVASVGDGMMVERIKLTRLLWDANISAEFSQQENPKLKYELANALEREIPFMAIVGEEEVQNKTCKIKDLKARTEETVPTSDLVSTLRKKGVIPVGCEFAAELLNEDAG